MSSPLAPTEEVGDIAVDEEMTNAVDQPPSPLPNGTQDHSSSTMDHDYNPQPETQPSQSAPHHNRKDATLREFLSKMDEYAPIIPDAVTSHYLTLSGLPPPNPLNPTDPNSTPLPLARLLALATQKFIADVAADAYQYSRIRASNTLPASGSAAMMMNAAGPAAVVGLGAGGAGGGGGGGAKKEAQLGVQRSGFGGGGQGGSAQGRTVLTMEDLGCAVAEYGVNVRRGEFYR